MLASPEECVTGTGSPLPEVCEGSLCPDLDVVGTHTLGRVRGVVSVECVMGGGHLGHL